MNPVSGLLTLLLFFASVSPAAVHKPGDPNPGVDYLLAQMRSRWISSLQYHLSARIPQERSEEIKAELQLKFALENTDHDLILDFSPGQEKIQDLYLNGRKIPWRYVNEHIIIERKVLESGDNTLICRFVMGDMSLNRRDDLMYTLFVPDRARTAFPCFDQPDLKGRFSLELDLPPDWNAVSNGPSVWMKEEAGRRRRIAFAPSHPLPTYLMAFAAGKLHVLEEVRDNRSIRLFHMEEDPSDLQRNVPEIFDLVFSSLRWMEAYTGIQYPFDKYDLVLVPSFQYGGMEHCGATLYRSSRLILDPHASLDQVISRAGLIAHETAHMWFGDLVTMPWFDEVWLKEVFAGFMADKIVKPLFPDLDHQLRFYLGHTPPALSVDRSAGTHPITQELGNLAEAGTLYGHLIYHKAPIVMEQLEARVGEENLRSALRQYLHDHAYGNAGWDSLIELLSKEDRNLKDWSRIWVYEKGLPTIRVRRRGRQILISQSDETGSDRVWSQKLGLVIVKGKRSKVLTLQLDKKEQIPELPPDFQDPDLVLLAGDGRGYGRMLLDRKSYAYLLDNPMQLPQALWRGTAWLSLWEGSLEGAVRGSDLLHTALNWVEQESDSLLLERILGDLPTLFWRLLPSEQRSALLEDCENRLWREMLRRPEKRRMAFLDAFRNIGCSNDFVKKIQGLLCSKGQEAGLTLSEQKEFDLILNLAIFPPPGFDKLVKDIGSTWKSDHRRKQLAFLQPLFSTRTEDWLNFFRTTLTKAENRENEPWVLSALSLIHHPLRSDNCRVLIPESLAMLPEIQQTGDIFFPIGWINETLSGHNGPKAAALIRDFLEKDTDLSKQLRLKVLQGADILLRRNTPLHISSGQIVAELSTLERPRNTANPDMLEKASQLIAKRLQKQGWAVRFQDFSYPGGTARNLSVLWGAKDVPRLVIGAHYDVCGDTPGADDNASGVAVLLGLAKVLSQKEPHRQRAVELVAYALEEPPYFGTPFMGSRHHALALKKKKRPVLMMISVDMVGYYGNTRSVLACIGRTQDEAHVLRLTAAMDEENMLFLTPLIYPESQRGIDWSDHRSFWAQGYPAVLFHSSPFFQNPNYHKRGDLPETVDINRVISLSRALGRLIEKWPF